MKKFKKLVSVAVAAAMVLSMAACGKNETKKIEGPDDLEGAFVGVQTGTTSDIYLSDEGLAEVERFNKGVEAVEALKQGKIDAVVIDDQPAKTFVEENEGLKILETEYVQEDYAFAFPKDSELTAEFNAVMEELKADGTFEAIVTYYLTGEGSKYESPADIEYNGTIVMATNAEFPPYEYYDGDVITGIDADFAKAIADKLGMELKIEDMAFDSIITAVETGKADFAAAGLTVTEDREKQVDFSESYYTGKQVIIVNK